MKMNICNKIGMILFCVFTCVKLNAQPIAFPNAEGFGKFATGGRGGKVVYVSNLNDAGEGSFRWALEQFPNEPLTVLFKVAGVIDLKSKFQIKRSNLTIAGQSAPGDGICFTGNSLIVNGASSKGNHGNIIIRFIRSRPGGTDKKGLYGFDMENCHDVIIDHCSFSWANEECAALYDTKNTTVQWCMVSEGLYDAGHAKGNRSYGGVWGGQFASYHHNLIAHQASRTVRFGGARAHDTLAYFDYRNNVIYNWAKKNSAYGGEIQIKGAVAKINIINNYYKPGPATPEGSYFAEVNHNEKLNEITKWYLSGNIMEGNKSITKNNFDGLNFLVPSISNEAKANEAFSIEHPIKTQSAKDAFKIVLKYAGAYLPVRDAVDTRVINETKTGTATGMGKLGKLGIIDMPSAVGGLPEYKSTKIIVDTDEDGMPDDWEIKNNLNPKDASDRNKVDKDGYTMLEKYLNELVKIE
jgi:hypothetical protein